MRQSAALILVLVALSVGFTACGGGSKGAPLASLKLVSASGSNFLSLKPGDKQFFAVQGVDKDGNVVTAPATITWSSGDSTKAAVSNSGLVCAGAWDSVTIPVVCTPGGAGLPSVTIKATGGGVSGTGTVWVHQPVQQVTIVPNPVVGCLTTGAQFTATACSNLGVCNDITDSVGPFTWTVNPAADAAVAEAGTTATNNPITLTSVTAGQVGVLISASAGNFTSGPVVFNTQKADGTCP